MRVGSNRPVIGDFRDVRVWAEKGSEYALWYRPADLQAEGEALPLYSEWFPGWHVGVLRGGREADTALYLNDNEHQWTVQTGHRQQDILSLSYYAHIKIIKPKAWDKHFPIPKVSGHNNSTMSRLK